MCAAKNIRLFRKSGVRSVHCSRVVQDEDDGWPRGPLLLFGISSLFSVCVLRLPPPLLSSPTARIDFLLLLLLPAGDQGFWGSGYGWMGVWGNASEENLG